MSPFGFNMKWRKKTHSCLLCVFVIISVMSLSEMSAEQHEHTATQTAAVLLGDSLKVSSCFQRRLSHHTFGTFVNRINFIILHQQHDKLVREKRRSEVTEWVFNHWKDPHRKLEIAATWPDKTEKTETRGCELVTNKLQLRRRRRSGRWTVWSHRQVMVFLISLHCERRNEGCFLWTTPREMTRFHCQNLSRLVHLISSV